MAGDEITLAAIDIATQGNPLEYMLEAFNELHKGDTLLAEAQFIAFGMQSASNSAGVFGTWEGPSGKGKSDAAKNCIRQLPPEFVITSSVTAKSLYYRAKGKDGVPGIRSGSVLFLDDKNIEAGSDLEETLKKMQTFFQQGAEHETIDKSGYLSLRLPPRVLVVRTYVDSQDTDGQLKNRTDAFGVDSSKQIDAEVHELLKMLGKQGRNTEETTRKMLICREMWRDLKNCLYRVILPLDFYFNDVSNRRNTQLFQDYVRGIACINHRQRRREEMGSEILLYADRADYQEAAKVFNSQGEYLGSRLNKSEFEVVKCIRATGNDGATLSSIFKYLNKTFPNDGWNTQKVRRLMDGRRDRDIPGLAGKIAGIESSTFYDSEQGVNSKNYKIAGDALVGVVVTID